MALAAAQVVDAVQALLVPVALTGGRVYTSRLWPLTEADLPAGVVFAADEQIEAGSLFNVEQHTLEIEAKGFVRETADLDDAMNDLAAAWLTALFAVAPPFNLMVTRIERDSAAVGSTSGGEASCGAITLHLQAIFETESGAPETIL